MNDEEYETQAGRVTKDIITQRSPKSEIELGRLIDYEQLYWEIKAALLGGWLSKVEGSFVIKVPEGAKPFMNEEGVENTMAFITGFVTKIPATSFYKEERILQLCEDNAHVLINFYWANMRRFDLTQERASAVINIILDSIEANYRRSLDGNMIRLLLTSEQHREVTLEKEKKKLLPFI